MAISRKMKKALTWGAGIATATLGVGLIAGAKINNPFRPTVMNYKAYISEDARDEINKKFNYKEFDDVSEFSKAIEDNRVVGGVGSDFQIARMIQKGLIRKVDYSRLFKANEELKQGFEYTPSQDSSKNSEYTQRRRNTIKKLLREETFEHIQKYDEFLIDDKTKKRVDIDEDGVADEMWEFLIPYYIQDKVMAYTVGDYQEGDKNIPLKPLIKKWNEDKKNNIRENGIRFEDQSMIGIGKTLRENGYTSFEWTAAMRDNLLAGSELNSEDLGGYSGKPTNENYKKQIDNFLKLIQDTTGAPLENTDINTLKASGLELLTALIDKGVPQEVGFIYNGDALDALNASDNFSYIEDGSSIKIIRPKNNLTLLDGWIITKDIDDNLVNQFLDTLYESVYKGEEFSVDQLIDETTQPIKFAHVKLEDEEIETIEENGTTKRHKKGDSSIEVDEEGYINQKGTGYVFDISAIPSLRNFDYVNYTPSFKSSYEFFDKMYFNDNTLTVKKNNSDEEYSILLKEDGTPLIESPNSKNIGFQVTSSSSKLAQNIYRSQQQYQTKNGMSPDESTPENDKYEIHYEFLAPINESLTSKVGTYYNAKTRG